MLKLLKWDEERVPIGPMFEDVPAGFKPSTSSNASKHATHSRKNIYTSSSLKHVTDMNVRSYTHMDIKHEIIHN